MAYDLYSPLFFLPFPVFISFPSLLLTQFNTVYHPSLLDIFLVFFSFFFGALYHALYNAFPSAFLTNLSFTMYDIYIVLLP